MTTLTEVKEAQPDWFSRGNKRFFGDASYRVLHGKQSRKPFLVRATFAWSDMFGRPRTLHYRVNPLSDALEIRPLVDDVFPTLDAVKVWLAER